MGGGAGWALRLENTHSPHSKITSSPPHPPMCVCVYLMVVDQGVCSQLFLKSATMNSNPLKPEVKPNAKLPQSWCLVNSRKISKTGCKIIGSQTASLYILHFGYILHQHLAFLVHTPSLLPFYPYFTIPPPFKTSIRSTSEK